MWDDNLDNGFGTYADDVQLYEPSFSNPFEDPWVSAETGATDFLGPQEEMQFEGFDSALTGDDNTSFLPGDTTWDDNSIF